MIGVALSFVGGKLIGLLKWFADDYKRIVIAVTVAAFMLLLWDRATMQHENADLSEQLTAEKSAHRQTVANYRAAATIARRLSEQNVAAVEGRWRQVLENANEDRDARLADYHQRIADFMRRSGRADSDRGGADGVAVPFTTALPGDAVHGAAAALVPVHPDDLSRCAAAFAGLEALIEAWNAAAAVETSPQAVSEPH